MQFMMAIGIKSVVIDRAKTKLPENLCVCVLLVFQCVGALFVKIRRKAKSTHPKYFDSLVFALTISIYNFIVSITTV